MGRERDALRASIALNLDTLQCGARVTAYAPDAERFWTAEVREIEDRVGNGGEVEKFVQVKFVGPGTNDDPLLWVRASELKPENHIEILSGPRPRAPSRLSQQGSEERESSQERAATADGDTPRPQKRRVPSRQSQVVDVRRNLMERDGADGVKEYLTVFADDEALWLPRDRFLDKDGTVTAALLMYEYSPGRIVQTSADGASLLVDTLVKWRGRSSCDWARIPAVLFTPAELEALKKNPPIITEEERDAGVERFYLSVQRAIRSHKLQGENAHMEHGFPTYLADDIFRGKGTALDPEQYDQRSYGDRRRISLTRAELDAIFMGLSFPDQQWDEVRDHMGNMLGRVDWDRDDAKPFLLSVHRSNRVNSLSGLIGTLS